MRYVAVIPARGGSRRLPRKNLADFRGRPIIAWTVAEALQCDRFERVLVSTEDDAIAAAGRAAGADISERPVELAGDRASLVDVGLDLLEREAAAGRDYDVISFLYPTAPLRNSDDINGVLDLLQPGICDFAMAVTRYAHPPHQALVRTDDGRLQPRWPDLVELSEAEAGPMVVDNGSTYAAAVPAFRRQRTFYGAGLRGWPMPFMRSIDIDEAEDLELARCVAASMGL